MLLSDYENWLKLCVYVDGHLKEALLNVLHNVYNNSYQGLPKNPHQLYNQLANAHQKLENLKRNKIINDDQWELLFPVNQQTISEDFDISLIMVLIINCTTLPPPKGGWKQKYPQLTDKSVAAFCLLAREMRNFVKHYGCPVKLKTVEFNVKWREGDAILVGLGYTVDTEELKHASLDPQRLQYFKYYCEHIQNAHDNLQQVVDEHTTDISNMKELSADVLTLKQSITQLNVDVDNINRKIDIEKSTFHERLNEVLQKVNGLQDQYAKEIENLKTRVDLVDTRVNLVETRVDLVEKNQKQDFGELKICQKSQETDIEGLKVEQQNLQRSVQQIYSPAGKYSASEIKISLKNRNNGFGPVSVYRSDRSNVAGNFFLGFVLVMLPLYHVCFSDRTVKHAVAEIALLYCSIISSLILGEIFQRIILYYEEKHHVETRYSGSKWEAFKNCIAFSKPMLVGLVFIVSTLGRLSLSWNLDGQFSFPWVVYMLVTCFSSVGMQLLEVRSLSFVEVSQLTETKVNNVATGLAWSYYFGYLKLILPGLKGMVRKAVKPNFVLDGVDLRDKISSEKVFIVIPKNCCCYESFTQVDERISFLTSMPEQHITRGGVQERVYKNAFYRVQVEGKEAKYVIMEYATPLLVLFDMSCERNTQFTEKDRDEQVVEFYKKLKFILESDPECRDKFHFVLVSDAHNNLADVIYQALHDENVTM